MQKLNDFVSTLNGYLFHDAVVYVLLATGILFTLWTVFGQYRAITHGVAVVRGKYDSGNDPGAINHFQALSAALSATVGLGNIAGVAVAVALGGPGAVMWMWVIGLVGMALKMTEVTQSMLYRNTDDPENPHGGPMFVAREGFKRWGLAPIGAIIGGIFVVTLLISALTGGNMFQAWNVADVTNTYFQVPQVVTGIVLSVIVAIVIIGGIKRIGSVAGRIVPLMCAIYLAAAAYVLFMNIGEIPAMLALIVKSGLGLEDASPSGAFLGGTMGYAMMWGIKRALFSSEAGQGSAPIAHAAAKTDEPVREGVVAGLEPLIDTLVVCTLTALVILSTGAYNRGPEAFIIGSGAANIVEAESTDDGEKQWTVELAQLPARTADAKKIRRVDSGPGWTEGEGVFVLLQGEANDDTGSNRVRLTGRVEGNVDDGFSINWEKHQSETAPTFYTDPNEPGIGIYGDYAGASLTAHAFDRVTPGLGMWLVTLAAWLFAISTMISWSYYGEQGIIYLGGEKFVFPYKIIYCILILLTTVAAMPIFGPDSKPIIGTDTELDMWTTLGLGVMLVANIPIMLIFGAQAMKAYHTYIGKLKRNEFPVHDARGLEDMMDD